MNYYYHLCAVSVLSLAAYAASAQAPVALFSADHPTTCDGAVNFRNLTVGVGTSYFWDFGDGNTSSERHPSHQYLAPGEYTVTLVAANAAGTDTLVRPGYAVFSEGLTIGCVPESIGECCLARITSIRFGQINDYPEERTAYEDLTCSQTTKVPAGTATLLKIDYRAFSSVRVVGWIDYNNDGVHTEAERVLNNTYGMLSLSIDVPITVPSGAVLYTPLLFRVWIAGAGTPADPCASLVSGQVRDYAVTVVPSENAPPIASFSAINERILPGGNVPYSDLSALEPTELEWNFPGGTPSANTTAAVSVTYYDQGVYDAQLIARNAFGADTLLRRDHVLVSEVYTMCEGAGPGEVAGSSAPMGKLYDSGGPDGNYSNGEDCQFLIDSNCGDTITLSFQQFEVQTTQTTTGVDRLRVYDGPDTSAPLLLDTASSFLIPPVVATSGQMLVRFVSDDVGNVAGFEADWQVTVQGELPVAEFEVSDVAPPLGVPVDFTDASTGAPQAWRWNFGDGTTSQSQNPAHAYDTPGTYMVQLIASGCLGNDTTAQTLTVQAAPAVSISPSALAVSLIDCDDTTTVPLIIQNAGDGALIYEVRDNASISVGFFGFSEETRTDLTTALDSTEIAYEAVVVGSLSPLPEVDVLMIGPEYETEDATAQATAFAAAGGTVVVAGWGFIDLLNEVGFETGLMTGSLGGLHLTDVTGALAEVRAPDDPITEGVPLTSPLLGTTVGINFQNADVVPVGASTAGGFEVGFVGYRQVEAGQIILLTFDYTWSTPATRRMLANAVASGLPAPVPPAWLTATPMSGLVASDDSATVELTLSLGDLTAGVNELSFVVATNDPASPSVVVPVALTVSGDPRLKLPTLNVGCQPFNQAAVGGMRHDSLRVENDGCDTLVVSGATVAGPYFGVSAADFSLPPGEGAWLPLTFSPDSVGSFAGALTLSTNASDSTVCLRGEGVDSLPTATFCQQTAITAPTGTLFDAGGPQGFGTATDSCSFLIAPPCVSSVALTFSNLQIAPDTRLRVFDGADTSAALLFEAVDSPSSGLLVAPSGQMFILLEPPVGNNLYNFEAEWTSVPADAELPLVAAFAVSDEAPPLLVPVAFDDETTGEPVGWSWDFDDGSTTTDQHPTHAYQAPGTYTVTLVVQGCYATDTTTRTLTVQAAPDAGLTPPGAQFDLPCDGSGTATLMLANTGAGTLWYESVPPGLEDAWYTVSPLTDTIAPGQSVTLTVAADAAGLLAGSYSSTLTLATNDPTAEQLSVPLLLTISGDTAATFLGPDVTGCLPLPAVFSGQQAAAQLLVVNTGCAVYPVSVVGASGDFTVSPTEATLARADSLTVLVTYPAGEPGTFSGTLTLGTPTGDTTFCLTAEVLATPDSYRMCADTVVNAPVGKLYDSGGPTGNYGSGEDCFLLIDPGCAGGITLTFQAFALEDGFDRLRIYDGTTANAPLLANLTGNSLPAPVTSFSGQMLLRMSTDGSVNRPGFAATWQADTPDEPPLSIALEGSPVAGETLVFSASGPEIVAYAWDFGPAGTSAADNPAVVFPDEGSFTVSLTVTTALGCLQTRTLEVVVTDLSDPTGRADWRVYPNPNRGRCALDLTTLSGGLSVEVFNALGQPVWQRSFRQSPAAPVALRLPAGGVYFVRVTQAGRTAVQKVVVR